VLSTRESLGGGGLGGRGTPSEGRGSPSFLELEREDSFLCAKGREGGARVSEGGEKKSILIKGKRGKESLSTPHPRGRGPDIGRKYAVV